MSESARVQLEPDKQGYYQCPLCKRTCTLDYFVGEHIRLHQYSVDGRPYFELAVEVAVTVTIHDRYQQSTVTAGGP